MKIGIVIPNTPGYSETFFNTLFKALNSYGFTIIIFTKDRKRNPRLAEKVIYQPVVSSNHFFNLVNLIIKTFYLLLFYTKPLSRYIKLLRLNNTSFIDQFKLVYINSHILQHKLDWLYFGFATMSVNRELVANAIGAKMAVSVRGYDVSISPLGKVGYYSTLWKYLDKLHYISDDLLKAATNLGLPSSTKKAKITPAIDIDGFTNHNMSNITRDKVKILTVARLHWKKGLNYSLLAMKDLADKGYDFEYTIIGEGNEFEHLCFMSHDLGLHSKVKLVGIKPKKDVIKQMHCSDIFVMPSVQEGFCNSVIEAQAAGLLCIVSDAEGLSENVINNLTGWVVPKRSSFSISDKIIQIINSTDQQNTTIINNALSRVKKEFNLDTHYKKWEYFFKNDLD